MSKLTAFLRSQSVHMSEADFIAIVRKAFEAATGSSAPVVLPPREVETLESAGLVAKVGLDDRMDPIFWGALDYAAIIASALSAQQTATLLDVNPSRIRQRLTSEKPTLYGIKPYGEWLLPRFQFIGKREVPGIAEVIGELSRALNPVSVVSWFNIPNPDLVDDRDEDSPMTPLAWLKAGHDPRRVAELAAQL
jgi:hypothetical protein